MKISSEQTNTFIEQGKKYGLTGKEVIDGLIQRGYEPEGVNVQAIKQIAQPATEVEKPSFLERIKTGIQERGENVVQAIQGTDEYAGQGAVTRGVGATAQAFGAISSTAYNALPEPARNALDKIGGGIGKGFQWLTDKIGNSKFLQEAVASGDTKKLEEGLKIASDLGLISGEILLADQAMKGAKAIDTGIEKVGQAVKTEAQQIGEGLKIAKQRILEKAPATGSTSESIMNKVARVSPKEAQTFKKMTGKSMGEYLTEKGNFNSPQKIIEVEAKTFAQTLADKEATLAKLPGTYKSGVVDDVLKFLKEKAIETSTKNVKAPYNNQVNQWIAKSKTTGLTMKEINDIKKLFEREVKLGYNKITDANKIKQATYVDEALGAFQTETASQLGFTNIKELSKQIQASKFIVDKLGNKIVNNDLLNGVSLTDYIILSGADPASIAGFLTKKLFSNKAIQAKIAKMLSNKTVAEPVKANYSRQATQAIQPKNKINTTAPINKSSNKISKKSSQLSTTPKGKVAGTTETNLLQEAKKYKSAEEFVRGQGEVVYRGGEKFDKSKIGELGMSVTTDERIARSFAPATPTRGTGIVEEMIINPNAKIATKKDIPSNLWKRLNEKGTDGEKTVVSYAKEKGFDVVDFGEATGVPEKRIINPEVIKTKSQLTDIWNKANKK